MSGESEQKPKIIIDEDWKSQVQDERDQVKDSPQAPQEADTGLPAASFSLLITTLATQALAAMGQIPDPIEQQIVINTDLARHHIDMLAMLDRKTQGNLEPDETQLLASALHQLRMSFVAVQSQPKST